jgi:iron complex outermembrane receptor protein
LNNSGARARSRTAEIIVIAAILTSHVSAAAAQERPSTKPTSTEETGPDIVVMGIRGSAKTDIVPIAELGRDALAAMGAQSIGDINRAIQGQTASASGADPITLLNGQRVSS